MNGLPQWGQWLQVASTAVIAIAATYIAFRQWRVAYEKIVVDLRDRRMDVFKALRRLTGVAVAQKKISEEQAEEFTNIVDEVITLFGDDAVFAVTALVRPFLKLQHSLQTDEQIEIIKEFRTIMLGIFAPYLRLKHRMPGEGYPSRRLLDSVRRRERKISSK